jgi:hypothetical protein
MAEVGHGLRECGVMVEVGTALRLRAGQKTKRRGIRRRYAVDSRRCRAERGQRPATTTEGTA